MTSISRVGILSLRQLCHLDRAWVESRPRLVMFIECLICDVVNGSNSEQKDLYFPRFSSFWLVPWPLVCIRMGSLVWQMVKMKYLLPNKCISFIDSRYGLWQKVVAVMAVLALAKHYGNAQYGQALVKSQCAINTYVLLSKDSCIHPLEFRNNKVTVIVFDHKCACKSGVYPCRSHTCEKSLNPIMEAWRTQCFVYKKIGNKC